MIFFSARVFAISCVSNGEIVDISMQIVPSRADSITPSFSNRTFLTSGVSVTQVITTSAFFAASAGVSAQSAPAEITSYDVDFVREWMTSGKPALSRFFAIGLPIIPIPMKAIFNIVLQSEKGSI